MARASDHCKRWGFDLGIHDPVGFCTRGLTNLNRFLEAELLIREMMQVEVETFIQEAIENRVGFLSEFLFFG